MHSSRGDTDPRIAETAAGLARRGLDPASAKAAIAQLIGTALGGIVRSVAAQVALRRVLIAGGDTSSYAARALGIEAVEVVAPLAPGIPLCRAHAPGSSADGLEVNFKGGQVGAEDYFRFVSRSEPWLADRWSNAI